MFKKKAEEVYSLDAQILDAEASFEAATNLFVVAREKLNSADVTLSITNGDIDAQIEQLMMKKSLISEQQERNARFGSKLEEFLT